MRGSQDVFKEMELDPDVGKMRPDQLNITEDPYFILDLDIDFDLAAFGIPSDRSTATGSFSPRPLLSSQSSLHIYDDEEPGLEIPPLDTPGSFGRVDVDLGAATSSGWPSGSRAAQPPSVFDEEPAIIEDPVFDIDDNGFLQPAMSVDFRGSDIENDGGQGSASEMFGIGSIGTGQETVMSGDTPMQQVIAVDVDLPVFADDDHIPAQAALMTPQPAVGEDQATGHPTSSVHPDNQSEEVSEEVEAPQRRARPVKSIRPDQRTELSNRDLNEWNENYLANMAAALRSRRIQTSRHEAKKNAEFWLLRQGIGNVATTFGNERVPHPLGVFSGQSLWEMLRGPDTGTKRSRSSSLADSDGAENARRVKARTASQEEVARGDENDGLNFGDEEDLMLQGDDVNIESEVGRHAPPSLPDRSSGMPWNISGSRPSSMQPLHRLQSSADSLTGGVELGPPSGFGRRGTRFTSASPLFGKGRSLSRLGSQEATEVSRLTSNEEDSAGLDMQLGADIDLDFELYGPSAHVDTQTAAQSQWIAETLENEAYNFLTFVNTKIQTLMEEDQERENVTFDELLPPTQNSQVVGAQALLHVLALATKGLLAVYQAEPFVEIELAVVSH
ncbi:hypothetical protein A1O3_03397 [Capronia epimyces CBS 606.96]|uniref:Rad21/Rec8-like protein C-terminal eukaryotic domain-containing protein n=1 Tax=Capronia epimyces CBS 606.96 TaxID=1182542 RepID=W9YB30_9EURO|nr:uncharacterized protein A1O3_03397 [Capronia epimyces CBS 606.96]EXJ86446.1 hypothetical protein A1O3_03397 [Capronia epimyces CBS 606.96]